MFSERLKAARLEKGFSQKQIAELLFVTQQAYAKYENDISTPNPETLSRIASALGVTSDYLLGKSEYKTEEDLFEAFADAYSPRMKEWEKQGLRGEEILKKEREFQDASYEDYKREYEERMGIYPITTQKIPLLGTIAAGEPIYADKDQESYVEVGTEIRADFCLKVKGDSMINARILDGDIVFIRKQPTVKNGEIAAVIISDEATLKRVYYYPEKNKLVLNAENPNYEPFVYIDGELENIRILGKAIAFQSNVI